MLYNNISVRIFWYWRFIGNNIQTGMSIESQCAQYELVNYELAQFLGNLLEFSSHYYKWQQILLPIAIVPPKSLSKQD